MLYEPCKVCKLCCEFIWLELVLYFCVRLFELLFIAIGGGGSLNNGVDLKMFMEFSIIAMIISIIFSCCCLKWEYRIRQKLKIQQEREIMRKLEKLENIIIDQRIQDDV